MSKQEKYAYLMAIWSRYADSARPQKAAILNEYCTSTELGRKYDLSAPVGIVTNLFSTRTSATTFRAFNIDITPDSRRILWRDNRNSPGRFELFSAAISVGTPAALVAVSGSIVENGSVHSILAISADLTAILFAADKDTDGVVELYAVAPTAVAQFLILTAMARCFPPPMA